MCVICLIHRTTWPIICKNFTFGCIRRADLLVTDAIHIFFFNLLMGEFCQPKSNLVRRLQRTQNWTWKCKTCMFVVMSLSFSSLSFVPLCLCMLPMGLCCLLSAVIQTKLELLGFLWYRPVSFELLRTNPTTNLWKMSLYKGWSIPSKAMWKNSFSPCPRLGSHP